LEISSTPLSGTRNLCTFGIRQQFMWRKVKCSSKYLKILCGPKRTTFNCGFKISFNLKALLLQVAFWPDCCLKSKTRRMGRQREERENGCAPD